MKKTKKSFNSVLHWLTNNIFFKNRIAKGITLLIISTFFFVSAIVKVPVLSGFHSYTFGIVLGDYIGITFYIVILILSIWILIQPLVNKYKNIILKSIIERITIVTISMSILAVALIIQFSFDVHSNSIWGGYNRIYQQTTNWENALRNSTNFYYPVIGNGLLTALIYDFICLLGSNFIPFVIALIIITYLIMVGIYKKPITLLLDKKYRHFVSLTKTQKKQKIYNSSKFSKENIEDTKPTKLYSDSNSEQNLSKNTDVDSSFFDEFEIDENKGLEETGLIKLDANNFSLTKEMNLFNKPAETKKSELTKNPFYKEAKGAN